MKEMSAAILKLENAVKAPRCDKALMTLLSDVGTNSWRVTRIIWVHGFRSDWSCSNSELRSIAFSMHAQPLSTKGILENMIGWVKNHAERHSKNQKMAAWTRYLYTLTSPYGIDAGVQQTRPNIQDFAAFMAGRSVTGIQDVANLHPFKPSRHSLGDCVPKLRQIKKWRPSGRNSNKVSAAAHMYTLHYSPTNFSLADRAWAGSVV